MLRRAAVALAIAGAWLLAPVSVYSDSDLTGLVAGAYFPRTESAELHAIAHQRAVEIAQPGGWCHCGQRSGTAEVLAYNAGYADPVSHAVQQWLGSPSHHAILSDPAFREIGCGSHFDGETYWAACVLTWGDSPPPQAPVPAPPAEVPSPTPTPDDAGMSDTFRHSPTPAPVLLPNTATEP